MTKLRKVGQTMAMYQEAIEGIADADASCLRIFDDGCSPLGAAFAVEIGMADAGTGFNDRNGGILAYEIYQSSSSTRNEQIDEVACMKEGRGCFMVGGQEGDSIGVDSVPT